MKRIIWLSANNPRQMLKTTQTILTDSFSPSPNKSHTGRNTAKQGSNLAVQLKNGFDRNSYRPFTVFYRSEIATNAQHRANGFGGYFLVFPQQIAHRATHGETGLLFSIVPAFGDIFELYLSSCSADIVDSLSAHIFQLFIR